MKISFLLGAGFSTLDRLPTRREMNKRLRKVSHDEILIHTDGTAIFLNGQTDPNGAWMSLEERYFVEKFIDYYTTNIIPNIENFDYEYFFDFYQGFIKGIYRCWRFEKFANEFRNEFNTSTNDLNLLSHFHNSFNQLIAALLSRDPCKTNPSDLFIKYSNFLKYINEIKSENQNLYFHTLNHDLLFEALAKSEIFEGKLTDGFEELGSPYYSKNNEGLTVRLKKFTKNFNSKFCLFKLHGSLDNYVFNFQNKEFEEVKIPYGVSTDELMKYYIDEDGSIKYNKCFWNYYPDFLSGATEKIDRYDEFSFYKPMFDNFKSNLIHSNILICIGYGFMDSKINEIIKDYFLTEKTKRLILINPSLSNSNIMTSSNIRYYGEGLGIQDISKDRIDELLKI